MNSRVSPRAILALGIAAFPLMTAVPVRAAAVISVSLPNTLAPNDDSSSPATPLGIDGTTGINFFGNSFNQVFVNNNGNFTFGGSLVQFTPNGLATGVGLPIIASFFADVDTRAAGSAAVTYGHATVNGLSAFVANYINVGYFNTHADKTNSFQMILFDRSDTGSGNFDIEFNYDRILWETGDVSGGTNGLGGTSAAVGYSNGLSGASNVFFQLPGSLTPGALLDGGPNSLVGHTLGSSGVLGRYDLQVRNGNVLPPSGVPEPVTIALTGMGLLALGLARRKRRRS
jgi:hypothetical protein